MTIGQKIREMRKQMGISQEMLGEILNVSRQAITKWKTDAGVPEVYNLQELSNVFGVPVDYFLSNKSINCNTKNNRLEIKDISNIKNNRLEIKDISNIKNASLVSFEKHFVYNDKMFHICTLEEAENIDNKKSLWLEIQGIIKAWLYIILGVMGMFAIIGLLLLIVGLIN